MEGRDGQVFRRVSPWRLVSIPKLTADQHALLGELEGGGLGEVSWAAGRARIRVLRRLIGLGCVEVMGMSSGRYRVTKLGKVARSLGVRS